MTQSAPIVELLKELVRIPSVSPGDASLDVDPTYGEARLAATVADKMRAMANVVVELEDALPGRPVVWGRLDAGCDETVLLEAHLDTVAPDPETPEPFVACESDEHIKGLGSADCKASLAAFLSALEIVSADPSRLTRNVVVAGVPDEEFGMTGSRHLAKRIEGTIDFAVCGEPTSLRLITRHKGVARWRVIVDGQTAHSSTPELGVNAIYRAAPLIEAIRKHGEALATRSDDDELGAPTATLTIAKGGTAGNIVPGSCELIVDRRLMPGESHDAALAEFKEALADAAPADQWRIEQVTSYFLPLNDGDESIALGDLQTALGSFDLPTEAGALHCATDAPSYTKHGCPAVVWGPGDIAVAHTKGESVAIDEVERAVDVLVAFLQGGEG